MEVIYSVYVVKCCDGTLYTGVAKDVSKRVSTHNNGKGAKYTRARLPVKLVFVCRMESRSQALRSEALIKRMTRAQKEILIKLTQR